MMALETSVFILFVFAGLYLTIIEVFTVLFMLTGMQEQRARFQVVSMLTNSGFTTGESEVIVSSRKRRSLAMITMLFGYTFTVTIVSTLVNVLISLPSGGQRSAIVSIIYLFVFLFILTTIKKIPAIKHRFDNVIRKLGGRFMFSKKSNPFLVLDCYGENIIAEVRITDIPECLNGKTLQESGIREKHGIQVLVIRRGSFTISSVSPADMLQPHDRIVMFGSLKNIEDLFRQKPSF